MENLFLEDDVAQIYKLSRDYIVQGDHIKALEVTEDSILAHGKDKIPDLLNFQQGKVFDQQAKRTENTDVKFAFLLGSVECLWENDGFSSFCALSLFSLGSLLGSSLYYKKSIAKAKEYLAVLASFSTLDLNELESQMKIESLLKDAKSRISGAEALVGSPMENCEPKVMEPKNNSELRKNEVKGLRSYWVGLNVEIKRNFLKVNTADFRSYVERLYGRDGRDALEQVFTSAREDRKWKFWMCRCCSKKFSSSEECKNHLEEEHLTLTKTSLNEIMPQRISKMWARKISVGDWKPVNVVAAIDMIKNRLEDVKAFVYKNGWSKDWLLAADEERSELLQEIHLLLVSYCDHKILACSIRDWVMNFVFKHLETLEVSKHSLTECRLVETPQIICFLECHELNQVLDFLRNIKCERDDGINHVSRAVDSFCNGTRVKEKIDFDPQFSFLLLDKRLLHSQITRFDDEGTINVLDPSFHYANTHAHGEIFFSWLDTSGDESFRFPRSIRVHNLDIWLAVMRAIQFACRNLEAKYAKKLQVLDYDSALSDAKTLCISEDQKRRNLQKDQWNRYASILCNRCEEKDAGNSLNTKLFLCAIRDVLKGASYPTFDFANLKDCLDLLTECKNLSDDLVLKSIDLLKIEVTKKVPIIDSKILLLEKSMINLQNDLARLSVFDYRSYILQPLKDFLLHGLVDMESKAKSAAAEADLLLEEENESLSKKKKNQIKRTSKSLSSPLDMKVEHEHSVDHELECTSPSLKMVEQDSMEPEDTLSRGRGRLEISLNISNQEKSAKDIQNIPGEDSLSEHLDSTLEEGAVRCSTSLDIMLKALLNIKVLKENLVQNEQPFHDDLEEQVPERLYRYLLSVLLSSLKEVLSVSSDAAEVVVAILEFWHCWKSPERESLVTRLFTLEEYERMSCRKCRKKLNYREQSSYGFVFAAESIRDLKCAFGNIKFENILKLIRVEDKMVCDIKTGGCGETNFVHHIISRCPPIFTIVLEWESDETEKDISETTKALDWEIDISRLYEGLKPNTKYRLVSMIGCGEEEKYICLAYKEDQWISFRHEALAEEVVGNWNSLIRFCGERKVRLKILFYEGA